MRQDQIRRADRSRGSILLTSTTTPRAGPHSPTGPNRGWVWGLRGTLLVVQSLCDLGGWVVVHCRANSAGVSSPWAEWGRLAL